MERCSPRCPGSIKPVGVTLAASTPRKSPRPHPWGQEAAGSGLGRVGRVPEVPESRAVRAGGRPHERGRCALAAVSGATPAPSHHEDPSRCPGRPFWSGPSSESLVDVENLREMRRRQDVPSTPTLRKRVGRPFSVPIAIRGQGRFCVTSMRHRLNCKPNNPVSVRAFCLVHKISPNGVLQGKDLPEGRGSGQTGGRRTSRGGKTGTLKHPDSPGGNSPRARC